MTDPTFVEDYNAIVEVLTKYIRGCAKADSSIMRPAFSEQATIFALDKDGKLTGGQIEWLFNAVDHGHPSPDAKAAIVRVDIVGSAANARIDTDNPGGPRFTDFLNLLKLDGEWIVAGKIYHAHA